MKFYCIRKIKSNKYADFSHVGTWSELTESCDECDYTNEKLIEPLLIEWETGSDIIGDFSYCGATVLVTNQVMDTLIDLKFDLEFRQVIVQRNTDKIKKNEKIVRFPYAGPPLNWIVPKTLVPIDINSNGIVVEKCTKCHREDFQFKSSGLVIDKKKVNSAKIFGLELYGASLVYISENGLEDLLKHKYTNFIYEEVGRIL